MQETDSKALKQSDLQNDLKRGMFNSLNLGDAMDSKGLEDAGSESGSMTSGKYW